ncbi:hypothetical protein DPMN_151166 [Dreissena polymorpha]|uniref:Uncharacterized protein n=1 Tax=Dreissena polymorpha TaxID=45954 RepID=A0A9D4J6P5_DREPO|nr:hypothetical protein DPMN_151166 [Dreissena polymorpha]
MKISSSSDLHLRQKLQATTLQECLSASDARRRRPHHKRSRNYLNRVCGYCVVFFFYKVVCRQRILDFSCSKVYT